ncbi:hypothetical protein CDAR_371841 [Caerostris darwini]|uniref:Uncharacterized protein n=1 Tax=Caerostris darwini TaxID=1538125 RepID=A0AAV4U0W7_9ARAC|nr:hypothetical protein CDAR_371841 [Caerostris darwini]
MIIGATSLSDRTIAEKHYTDNYLIRQPFRAAFWTHLNKPILKIMDVMVIKIVPQAEQLARKRDARRVYTADSQSTSDSKKARTARKKAKSEEAEEYERTKGILYGAGIAD